MCAPYHGTRERSHHVDHTDKAHPCEGYRKPGSRACNSRPRRGINSTWRHGTRRDRSHRTGNLDGGRPHGGGRRHGEATRLDHRDQRHQRCGWPILLSRGQTAGRSADAQRPRDWLRPEGPCYGRVRDVTVAPVFCPRLRALAHDQLLRKRSCCTRFLPVVPSPWARKRAGKARRGRIPATPCEAWYSSGLARDAADTADG